MKLVGVAQFFKTQKKRKDNIKFRGQWESHVSKPNKTNNISGAFHVAPWKLARTQHVRSERKGLQSSYTIVLTMNNYFQKICAFWVLKRIYLWCYLLNEKKKQWAFLIFIFTVFNPLLLLKRFYTFKY